MSKNKDVYLVLFKDGSVMPVRHLPKKEEYQADARFFEVNECVTMGHLSLWYAEGNKDDRPFREIK